ncbi:MAG: flagellar basal body L-ring protein FlgH, partial [bacterium]|nr:flagellar basal body L-ring protein FlgH [bacterium]
MLHRVREIAAAMALAALACSGAAPAHADTLYQAAAPAGPARPLDLFSDHRARVVGDLVTVVFNFAVTSNSTQANSSKKDYALNLGPGLGNLALGPLRFATGMSGNTGTNIA